MAQGYAADGLWFQRSV